jgi:uncharacterized protein with ParB-like and HNH nuclease domain
MKTDKITVADLFEKQRRYLVPLFQRGYVWTLEGQLKPLWRDVLDQAELQRDAKRGTGRRTPRKHFLGAVVFNQVDSGVRHVPISEVIDGQQRLTTLQVLLIAFRDVVATLQNQFLTAKLRRLTENEGPYPDASERFKVWPTNAFRDDFQAIATRGSVQEVKKHYPPQKFRRKWLPQPLLVQGYLFFHEAITRFLKGEEFDSGVEDGSLDLLDQLVLEIKHNKALFPPAGDAPFDVDRAELLLETLTGHIQLVEISLEGEDDPQIIFETLNARGAPLQPSDLVRNFVFLYATRHQEDVSAIYENSWKEFDEAPALIAKTETNRFWKDSERQGRLRSSRLDLFLYHYVTFRTGHDLKIGHIFQEFREWWENAGGGRVAAEELKRLRESANAFRELVVPNLTSRFGIFGYRLKVLDTMTAYPLVLHVAEHLDEIDQDDFEGMLLDLESYLVRRAICNLTPKNYNRVFLGLLKGLQDATPISRRGLQDLMLQLSSESALWPDDAMVEPHFIYEPLYARLRQSKTRMLLEGLETAMHTSKQEFFPFEDPLTKPLTIEHVMPQWGSELHWPKPAPKGDGTPDYAAIQRRSALLHSIGNLTLLTQPLNSSVSNGPFSDKRREIALQSRLQLNSFFQTLADDVLWDEAAILIRANRLFKLFCEAWPYPTAK